MHEPSIRVPLVMRFPPLVSINKPQQIEKMVLHVDLAPSILELCEAPPLEGIHGKSWKPLVEGRNKNFRTSFHYAYNYEKQFPYTPNIRGVRTDLWKLIRYPHGDGGPDRHQGELYDLKNDPHESKNLFSNPDYSLWRSELQRELDRLLEETGALPDKMPLDEGIKAELPDLKIR
jgi:N-acetylglucosamine-6-sulfatase